MINKIYIIPTVDKPVKIVFPDKNNIEEDDSSFVINETIFIEEAIRRVEAAGNDPNRFIDILIKDGRWEGMIIWRNVWF